MDAPQFLVREARIEDSPDLLRLLEALELAYPSMDPACFWVGEWGGEIVATAELKELGSCSLLSCVGVREGLQGRGFGRLMVDHVIRQTRQPVYLYTVVPGFFRKVGFRDAIFLPADMPPRSIYGCVGCDPSVCLCLVRFPDVP